MEYHIRVTLLWAFVFAMLFLTVAVFFCVGLNDIFRMGACYQLLDLVGLAVKSVMNFFGR